MNSADIHVFASRDEWRRWLDRSSASAKECWVLLSRSRTSRDGVLRYLDAVEEALCFGWIDSTLRRSDVEGCVAQRFSPRRRGSSWTELNKARCERLIGLGLMTERGMAALPADFGKQFVMDAPVLEALQADPQVWRNVLAQPDLYRRVRIDGIQTAMRRGEHASAMHRLARYVECSRRGVLYGEWDDDGRLKDWTCDVRL